MSAIDEHPTISTRLHAIGWTVTPSGCWEWNGSRSNLRGGYGQMSAGRGRVLRVHRVAYELWVAPIPAGLFVCHRCDNPPCINPDHLFLGTNRENSHDMVKKGRGVHQVYESADAPAAKLTPAEVRDIRAALDVGASQTALAAEYGVTKSCIWQIKKGLSWSTIL